MTEEIATLIARQSEREVIDTGGIGGTLAGNALSLAAMRATLTEVLTDQNFVKMIELGNLWCDGVEAVIAEFNLPWHVNRLGARGEYLFQRIAPRTGGEAARAVDFELEQYIHLRLLNDGILLTPFHNMALMSPYTSKSDVEAHTAAYRVTCALLLDL
jgi:glutamate-1-semialdehyde 2,1-aminomutase